MALYQKIDTPVLPDGKIQILWGKLERGERVVIDYDGRGNLRKKHVHTNPHNGKETEMIWWRGVKSGIYIVTEHGTGSSPAKPALSALEHLALGNRDLKIDAAGNLITSKSKYVEM